MKPANHKLPYMDRGYICFPDWAFRWYPAFRVCVWIGETFNKGCYCFTLDESRSKGGE